jgi:hypothetical protein
MDEEDTFSIGEATDGCDQFTSEILPTAARELAAFARVVTEQYGFEQARQGIEDWIAELELSDWPSGSSTLDCRRVTIAAAARLAQRVTRDIKRARMGAWLPASSRRLAYAGRGPRLQDGPVVVDAIVDPFALSLPSHVPFHTAKGFTLSLAKQVLSGRMDSVIKTIEHNVRLI